MRSKHSIIRLEVASITTNLEPKFSENEQVQHKDFSNETIIVRIYFFGKLNVSKTEEKIKIGSENDLNARGLIVEIYNEKIIIKNDWLGSIPLFFNRKNLTISTDFNFCVDERKIDELGLGFYLKYGYSVFGRTPIQNVEFLEYCSEISIIENKIFINRLDDPVLGELNRENSNVKETINLIYQRLEEFTENKEKIIIPLSGGYDSRLLTLLMQKSIGSNKILNISYGYSSKQFTSFEVEIAREVSSRLKTNFKWLELGNENLQISDWLSLKGSSTHLHGMYQIDFYKKIKNEVNDKTINLSGIYGDLWAGKILSDYPVSTKKYEELFLSHGLTYSKNIGLNNIDGLHILTERYEKEKQLLTSNFYRAVSIARNKMILLSYLIDVPQNLGIETYSPFLDLDVVSSMLRTPLDQWVNRKWQDRIFDENNLLVKMPITIESRSNMLFINSYKSHNFPAIEPSYFKGQIKDRVIELNYFFKKMSNYKYYSQYIVTRFKLKKIPLIGKFIKEPIRDAIYDYYHLAPLEQSLNKTL